MANGPAYVQAIKKELNNGRRQWRRGDNLLAAFGYTRRRQTAIDAINAELLKQGIVAKPPVTPQMVLSAYVGFTLQESGSAPSSSEGVQGEQAIAAAEAHDDPPPQEFTVIDEPPATDAQAEPDRALIVGNLECAERQPTTIKPTASIEEALTIMDLRDFSQLVVVAGLRDVRGTVSYKSIARAYLHASPKTVSDCIDATAPRVERNEPLLRVVERFGEHDAVIVMAPDKSPAGIVTPADIAVEFGAMAGPFLLVGQIEEQLRWLVKTKVDISSALAAASATVSFDGATAPDAKAPDVEDLTMGELQRILEHADNWAKVGIKYDRATFCKELGAVRELRNAVMHFRDFPDPAQFKQMKDFAAVVQRAYRAVMTKKSTPPPAAVAN